MRMKTLCLLSVVAVCAIAVTSAQADYMSEVAADNPFVYFHLDEVGAAHGTPAVNSGSAAGAGQYGRAGGTAGSIADAISPVSTGKQFNRDSSTSGSHIYATGPYGIQPGASYSSLASFTIECLLRPNYDGALQAVYASSSWAPGAVHLNVGDGSIGYSIWNFENYGTGGSHTTSTLVPSGTWAHVALTRSSDGTATLYVNGSPLGSTNLYGAGTVDLAQEAYLGVAYLASGEPPVVGASRYLDGTAIDEFAIYNTALSPAQILAHANAAVPEPGTLVLISTGVLGLLAYAWRKR